MTDSMPNTLLLDFPSLDIDNIAKTISEAQALDLPEDDLYHLFSLSPLSSADSSRNGSPVPPQLDLSTPTPPNQSNHPPILSQVNQTSTSMETPLDGRVEGRRKAKKRKGHDNRKKKRAAEASEHAFIQARPDAVKKHVLTNVPVYAPNDAAEGPTTKGSYIGGRSKFEERRVYRLEDLVGPGSLGFSLVMWDGCTATPLLDSKKRIIGVLAGQADVPAKWLPVTSEAVNLIEAARLKCHFDPDEVLEAHRRGQFPTLRSGISYGGGQTKPTNLQNSARSERIVQELNESEPFKRIAGFGSSVFSSWAPKLYDYYSRTLDALIQSDPSLKRPFRRGVFSAVTYNLGPSTICFPHTDFANLPFGWCSITALGRFDHTKGGHLVLWDCGLVIQFPAGSTILIPSALIAHSNTSISTGETRYSFTSYTAGGLFRWVDLGFKTMDSYKAGLSKPAKEEFIKSQLKRWEWGLSLWRQLPTDEPDINNVNGMEVPQM